MDVGSHQRLFGEVPGKFYAKRSAFCILLQFEAPACGGGEQACCPVSIVHASTIDYRIYQHGPQQTHVAFSEFYCVDSTGYHVCIQSYAMVQDLMFEMLPAPELSIRVL